MAVVVVDEKNFEEEVLKSDIPVLVDFWASWCGPCKMLAPVVEQVSEETAGAVKMCKVNVDDCMSLAQKYNVVSIPTLVVFENGSEKKRSIGFISKNELKNLIS